MGEQYSSMVTGSCNQYLNECEGGDKDACTQYAECIAPPKPTEITVPPTDSDTSSDSDTNDTATAATKSSGWGWFILIVLILVAVILLYKFAWPTISEKVRAIGIGVRPSELSAAPDSGVQSAAA